MMMIRLLLSALRKKNSDEKGRLELNEESFRRDREKNDSSTRLVQNIILKRVEFASNERK